MGCLARSDGLRARHRSRHGPPTINPVRFYQRLVVTVLAAVASAAMPVLAPPAHVAAAVGLSAGCGAAPDHVALVIDRDSAAGDDVTACVGISGSVATGAQILEDAASQDSGITYGFDGSADNYELCMVDDVPASWTPSGACLSGSTTTYWQISTTSAGNIKWQYANLGISNITVESGGALGLVYSSAGPRADPPSSWAGICPPPTPPPSCPTATASPSRTPTPRPSPVATVPSPSIPSTESPSSGITPSPVSTTGGSARPPVAIAARPAQPKSSSDTTIAIAVVVLLGLAGLVGFQVLRAKR